MSDFDAPEAEGNTPDLSPPESSGSGGVGGATGSGTGARKLIPGSIADQIAKNGGTRPDGTSTVVGTGANVANAATKGASGSTAASKVVGGGLQGAVVQGTLEMFKKENRSNLWRILIFSSPVALFLIGALIITLGMGMMSFTSQNNNSGMAGQSADAAKISGLSDSDYEYVIDGAKRNDVPWQVLAAIYQFEKNQPKSQTCAPSGSSASMSDLDVATMAGQHVLVGANPGSGSAVNKAITDNKLGGVFLLGNWSDSAAIKSFASAVPKSGDISPTIAGDREGGQIQMNGASAPKGWTSIPSAVDQGKMSSGDLASKWATWGKEMKDAGMTTDFGPVADVVKDASKSGAIGKYNRQYGSDASKVAPLVGAVSKGLSDATIESVGKHFPGLGNITGNTDFNSDKSSITDSTTTDSDLSTFKSVTDNTGNIMVSTAYYDKLDPSTQAIFSSKIVTDLLRKKLGFNGVVYSDEIGSAKAASNVAMADRAVKMIEAGGDVALASNASDAAAMVKGIVAKANSDEDFKKKLTDSTSRVVSAKKNYGSGADSASGSGSDADNGNCSSSPGDTGSQATDAGTSTGTMDTSKYNLNNVKGTLDSINEAKKSGDRWRLLLEVVKYMKSQGWTAFENPIAGGVSPGAHMAGSLHYYGQAFDMNIGGPGDNDPVEVAAANKIMPLLRSATVGWVWQAPGHLNHVHVDTGDWYSYNPSNPSVGNPKPDCAVGMVPAIYGSVLRYSPSNKIHFEQAKPCAGGSSGAGTSSASTATGGKSDSSSSDKSSSSTSSSSSSSEGTTDSNADTSTCPADSGSDDTTAMSEGAGKGDVVNDNGKYHLQWVKKTTQKVAYEIGSKYNLKTIYGWRDPKVEKIEPGGHPAGNSVDFMISDMPDGEALGHKIADDLISRQGKEMQIREIIYRQHMWLPSTKTWKLMEDRGSPTANHMDHVHLSIVGDTTPIPAGGPAGGASKDSGSDSSSSDSSADDSSSSNPCVDTDEQYITDWNIPENGLSADDKKKLLASHSADIDWVAQILRKEMNKPANRDYYDMHTGETHAPNDPSQLYVDPTKDDAALVAKAWQSAIEATKLKNIDSESAPTIYNVALQWFLGNKATLPTVQDAGAGGGGSSAAEAGSVTCTVNSNGAVIAGASYNKQQLSNAALIVKAGEDNKVPDKAIDVALAAALGESTMRRLAAHEVPESLNYPHDGFDPSGRGSSGFYHAIGILQQRVPNFGWGTVAQAMDPYHAAEAFLGVAKDTSAPGLKQKSHNFAGIDNIDLGVLVNDVQEAALPSQGAVYRQVVALYNSQGKIGQAMHKIVKGANCSSSGGGAAGSYTGPVGDPGQYKDYKVPDGGCTKCVEAALKMVGMPYVYGGGNYNGPTGSYTGPISKFNGKPGFDCSGLMMFAYHQAGAMDLPSHLASDQRHLAAAHDGGLIYDPNKLKPGMMLFNHADSSGGAGHVGMYMGNGLVVEAPRVQDPLHVIKLTDFMKWNGTFGGGNFPKGYNP